MNEQPELTSTTSRPTLTTTKSSLKPQKVLWLRNLVRSVSTRSSSSSNTVNNQLTKAPSTTTSLRTSQKLFPFQSLSSAPLPSSITTQNEEKQINSNQSSTVSKTPLVEIKSRPPDQDHARKIIGDPINQSAFDDLPPPELYDPSWNTLPLRCEAGVLGKQSDKDDSSQPKGPILPVAFTLHSSDLEDTSDEEDEEIDYQYEHQINNNPEVKNIEQFPMEKDIVTSEATSDRQSEKADSQNTHHRSSLRSERSLSSVRAMEEGCNSPGDVINNMGSGSGQRKSLWRKVTASKNTSVKKPSMFQVAHPMMVVMEDIRLLIEEDYGGEVNGFKNGEVRAKVPITINENENVYQIVFTIEEKSGSGECTVWIRRSFGETFRISNDDFDWFCDGFTTRFKQLRQFDHLAKRKSSIIPTLSNSEEK